MSLESKCHTISQRPVVVHRVHYHVVRTEYRICPWISLTAMQRLRLSLPWPIGRRNLWQCHMPIRHSSDCLARMAFVSSRLMARPQSDRPGTLSSPRTDQRLRLLQTRRPSETRRASICLVLRQNNHRSLDIVPVLLALPAPLACFALLLSLCMHPSSPMRLARPYQPLPPGRQLSDATNYICAPKQDLCYRTSLGARLTNPTSLLLHRVAPNHHVSQMLHRRSNKQWATSSLYLLNSPSHGWYSYDKQLRHIPRSTSPQGITNADFILEVPSPAPMLMNSWVLSYANLLLRPPCHQFSDQQEHRPCGGHAPRQSRA